MLPNGTYLIDALAGGGGTPGTISVGDDDDLLAQVGSLVFSGDILDIEGPIAIISAAPLVHTHAASEITDFSEAVDDRVAALLTAGDNVVLTYGDEPGDTLTISVPSMPWADLTGVPTTLAGYGIDDDVAALFAAHVAAADPHPTYTTAAELAAGISTHEADTTAVHGIANTAVLAVTNAFNTFTANQAISINQNNVTHFQVSNTTSGTAALAGFQFISDNNAAGATRSVEIRLKSEGHSTDPGVALWAGTNIPEFLVSIVRGSTAGAEKFRVRLGGTAMFAAVRLDTTNRRIISFYEASPPDLGGDEWMYLKNTTTAPTSGSVNGAVVWAASGNLHSYGDLISHGNVYANTTSNVLARANHTGTQAWATVDKTVSSLADLATRSATDLTGTLADARLSSNVPLLNASNIFTGGTQTFEAVTFNATATFGDTFEALGGLFDGMVQFNGGVDMQFSTLPLILPHFTTTQRDSLTASNGMCIYNSTVNKAQVRAAGVWDNMN